MRRGPLVFNIQDVFPDAAVETGAITDKRIIAVAKWLERVSYNRSAAVTVLSDDLRDNVVAKVRPSRADAVRVIPNFVDTDAIRPLDRMTALRSELGIGDETVVLYAGNVGFSQSLEMVVAVARTMPELTFLINGDGAARATLEASAKGVGEHPLLRLSTGRTAGRSAGNRRHPPRSVEGRSRPRSASRRRRIPSSQRVARCSRRSIPEPRCHEYSRESGGGVAVAPDDPDAFRVALQRLAADGSVRA